MPRRIIVSRSADAGGCEGSPSSDLSCVVIGPCGARAAALFTGPQYRRESAPGCMSWSTKGRAGEMYRMESPSTIKCW